MEAYQQWSLLVMGRNAQKYHHPFQIPWLHDMIMSHDGGGYPRIIDQELKGEGGEISADFEVILLMVQKSQSQPPFGCIPKPRKSWEFRPTFPSTGERRIHRIGRIAP